MFRSKHSGVRNLGVADQRRTPAKLFGRTGHDLGDFVNPAHVLLA